MCATMLDARPVVPGEDRRHGVSVAAQAQPDRWWFGLGRPTRPIEAGEGRPDGARAQRKHTTTTAFWQFVTAVRTALQ